MERHQQRPERSNSTGVAPFSMTLRDATAYTGLSRATLYRLANEGRLDLVKVRGRTLTLRAQLERLLLERQ
jgi:excisionase family DNA binding protein